MDYSVGSVVVTGPSSGIGRASVARLAKAGWRGLAAVRKQEDGADLQRAFGTTVTPLIMDVTQRDTIEAAARMVTAEIGGRGLNGLVNVAGIGMVRPVEYATYHDMKEIFEINVFGQIAVTQAF